MIRAASRSPFIAISADVRARALEAMPRLISVRIPRPANKLGTRIPDPSEEEIRERASEIQAGWTDQERCRRIGVNQRPVHWQPLLIDTTDLDFRPEDLVARD